MLLLSLFLAVAGDPPSSQAPALPEPAREALDRQLALAGAPSGAWAEGSLVRAAGFGWRASLQSEGLSFTPALGSSVPSARTLELRPRGIFVEDAPVGIAGSECWSANGAHADRSHGNWSEHADARERGLELWAELHELPVRGELVLSYDTGGDLLLAAVDESGADFLEPQIGGVRIQGVLGIDALGHTCRGSIRAEGGRIDFVLPESFVQNAALPLIVDPLITPVVEVGLADDDQATDIAYDTSGNYLVVWEHLFALDDTDIYAWRRDADGNPFGFLIGIAADTADEREPAVGMNPNTDEFVVAWSRRSTDGDYDLWGVEVSASTGFVGPAKVLVATPFDEGEPTIADERPGFPGDADLLVGWRAEGDGLLF